MRFWKRRRKAPHIVYFKAEDGTRLPSYAVRAGMFIVGTDYEHGRSLTVTVTPGDRRIYFSEAEVSAALRCAEDAQREDPLTTVWAVFSHLEGRCHCKRSVPSVTQS